MTSLAENVDENPRHIPWINKNMEFEGGRQNMMGFSCMKHSLPPWQSKILLYPTFRQFYCTRQESQQATQRNA